VPTLGMYFLGSFQISLDDQNMTAMLRTEKERALLTYLAVESDHAHRRETLAEFLWPERPEGVARTNLRQALLGVRRAIGDRDSSTPYLQVDDEMVQFDCQRPFWLDIEAFNSHIQTTFTHNHKSVETCLSCAQHLQEAVDLYRGDFLMGLFLPDCPAFLEWAAFHREQYFRYLLSALQTLSDYFQNMGDFDLAHKYARRLVSLDSLDESAHRRLMHVLASSGRRASALEQYQVCRRILINEFGVEPSVETISLFEKIKNGDALPSKPVTGTLKRVNLPTQFTSFFGREDELHWVGQALTNPVARLITIVGMGGVGKTRLALQAAEANGDLFPDGVRFVPLDTISSPDLVVPSIAQALGFSFRGDSEPKKQLIRFLRSLRTLLIFDSVEHLIDQTGLILEILQQAPGVKCLVTTRQRLNYQAATVLELKGLAYPADVSMADPSKYPALELFLNRARSRAGFVATEKDLAHIVQICKMVGGLPLGLELAAGRLREFSCEVVLQDLQRDMGILQSSMLDMPERHRNMRSVFEQSWKRLTETEKNTYRRLAVFQDNFLLEAAQAIAGASLALMSTYMDRSLLQGDASHGFALHPLLKQFASEKLAAVPEEGEKTYDLHSQYYFSFLQQRETELQRGTRRQQAMLEFESQIENIRSALARASYRKQTAALTKGIEALKRFYDLRNELRETRPLGPVSVSEEPTERTINTMSTRPIHFKAETRQLLDILIHSLYTDREIFLRELISNASDALTRMDFEQLTNRDVHQPDVAMSIRIKPDLQAKTLTITDTGIGMTAKELTENLGTIAHSGARSFIEAAKASGKHAMDVIGQFGVGFYAAFMVAESIQVVSHSYLPDAQAAVWKSDGGETFTVTPAEKAERGTDVIIHLKEDALEFLQEQRLKDIVRKHSDFVSFPIYVGDSDEQVNRQTALWRQSPRELEKQSYDDFYKQLTLDFEAPLSYGHLVVDAPVQVYAVVFFPSRFDRGFFSLRKEDGIKLYARKILIQEYCKDLLPEYFRFVQGVVDSEDLPLNVSRESVQANRVMAQLKKLVTGKVIDSLKKLANEDAQGYATFWKEFGRYIKEGVAVEQNEPENLHPLLRFHTTTHPDTWNSLDEYLERMQPDQKDIYYILGDDERSLVYSPHLDVVRRYEYEVLFMTDPVDAFMLARLARYKEHALINVATANLKMPETPPDSAVETPSVSQEHLATLIARFKEVLGERVSDVRSTDRLSDSPARLVDPDGVPNQELQRVYRLLKENYVAPKKVLEVNPRHPILVHLDGLSNNSPLAPVIIEQVYENALLIEGLHPDPAGMISRIQKLMEAALNK